MDITYKTKKLRRICTDAKTTERAYGIEMAAKIHQRIDEISAADSVEVLIKYHMPPFIAGQKRTICDGSGSSIQIGIRKEWRQNSNRSGFGYCRLSLNHITKGEDDETRRRDHGEKSQLYCYATWGNN